MTIYNEITNMEEMGLTIESIRGLLGAIYLKKETKHNIVCMAVQTAQETLQDVTKDKSTHVKADSRTTIQDADIMATSLNRDW